MATRKEVAERAGVSVATVSYVMNHFKSVTPEVERRVLDAIRELDYRPNLLARGLSTKKTRHVAMLVDNLNNPHYCEMLSGAQAVASKNGYIVSVISVDISSPHDMLNLASRVLDGVILALANDNPRVEQLISPTLKTVRPGELVTIDYEQAVDDMVSELIRLGHERIAFLSGIPIASSEHARYRAWKAAFERRGLELSPELIVDGLPRAATDEAEGMRAMNELIERKVPFTAVYAINDLMALGAMRVLQTRGYSIPKDVSLVGCDKLKILRCMTPTLASMDVRAFETGESLMRLLIERAGDGSRRRQAIRVAFSPGESIGPAPKP